VSHASAVGGGALETEVLVVGSGAGGAVTAAILAEAGHDVLLLEEGPDVDPGSLRSNSVEAFSRLYRNGGMTPILGRQNIAFVEGRCVGGSTEVNSGFWHRLPPESYSRWRADHLVEDFTLESMEGHFQRIEADLSVSKSGRDAETEGSAVMRRGIEALGWAYEEVPRCQKDPRQSAFAPGAKQSMQRTYVPRAVAAGAKLVAGCKVLRVLHEGGRARGVEAWLEDEGGGRRIDIRADAVFVCCGAIQTPALLRRSGIRRNVGNSLRIHPMIKAAALFDEPFASGEAAIPAYQVKEFWPTITLGGSVFTPGFLAMLLSENWQRTRQLMQQSDRMGLYYAATRGLDRGSVRAVPGLRDGAIVRYRLNRADQRNLSIGLARLGELLFAAGAKAVYPSLRSLPVLSSAEQCRGLLKAGIPLSAMSLSTVHVFSSCPMGENPEVCATDSFGRVSGFANLHIGDASLLPDSPGVNPQGTTMAIALRNALHFHEGAVRRRRGPRARTRALPRADVLVTGASGWLGSRLVGSLAGEGRALRGLVRPDEDSSAIDRLASEVQVAWGDLADPASLRSFCRDAEGATLFHVAGVIHPRRTREFTDVNVEGTRRLLAAAEEAGVKRVVAVSSNSPFGANPRREHLFDEQSPFAPYLGYGRSKAGMEDLVRRAGESGRLETVLVRAPWFYGPNQPARQTTFFEMIRDGRFPILGDGEQRRSMAYVDNLCDGLRLAAESDRAAGRAYWIADARPYPVNEIVDTVEDVLEREFGIPCARRRLRVPAWLGDGARLVDRTIQATGWYEQRIHVLGELNLTIACSIERARDELGYEPRVALREGMIASVRWCLEQGQVL
jgi:nucleoside-diphosphate-sugar epimerase/choline dehydrogenase-like flavoprotein